MSPLSLIAYPLLATAALNLAFGIFLLTRGRRNDPTLPRVAMMALIASCFALTMGIAYLRASLGLDWNLYYRFAWVGWLTLAPLSHLVFTLRDKPRQAKISERVLYALWGAILISCLTTDLFEVGALSLVPFVDLAGPLENATRLLGSITLAYVLFGMFQARRASSGRRRQQLGYLLLGTAVYALAGLLLAGIPAVFSALRFDPGLVSGFSAVWMALTFYAVTRHRLFDIRFVLSKLLVALILVALLATSNFILFWWFAPVVGPYTAAGIVSVITGLGFFTTPLVTLIRRATEQSLVLTRYDHHRVVKESAQALASLTAMHEVLRMLLDLSRATLGSTSGAIYLAHEEGFLLQERYGPREHPRALRRDGALVQWLGGIDSILIRDELESRSPPSRLAALNEDLVPLDAELAAKIAFQGELVGVLVLGRKQDREPFFQHDLDLLETLVTEAAIALANAHLVEELRQAVKVRDDFLAVAGHELRTPLTALLLNVESMANLPSLPHNAQRKVASTHRQVLRLSRLTSELLDVSRISLNRLELERETFDLAALVSDVADRFCDDWRDGTSLDLQVSGPLVGLWDRLRLEQVVSNLISNAIKYGRGRPVHLDLRPLNGCARLTVRDEGIGIATSDQHRIFERFERAVSQQHYGGFGLGLWITKQVVEAHGGRIGVASEPGEGSTFTVDLPLASAASTAKT